ncbi:hypothetical protein ACU8KH_00445 [Lachancea thermotolerans]
MLVSYEIVKKMKRSTAIYSDKDFRVNNKIFQLILEQCDVTIFSSNDNQEL